MQFRLFKLRFRRRLKHQQQQVEDLSLQAEAGLERLFFRRLGNLSQVWRFVGGWLLLVIILAGSLIAQLESLGNHYQNLQPVPGGVYTEGLVGTFSNANPVYAVSEVDTTVSHLLFAGLFTYDTRNHLVGDLASRWDVNALGTVYTVHLKPNLTWQDGSRLTAEDVVFTYKAIQNPDAQSPLASSWQGINVAQKDAYTVTFTLPDPLSSFPYSLTNGIIPAHAFAGLPASEWRSADFNSLHPVGAGPFAWSALQVTHHSLTTSEIQVALKPFAGYVLGKPKLDSFVVHAFSSQKDMIKSFQQRQLTAISLQQLPASLARDKKVQEHSFMLTGATMAFFNNSHPAVSDVVVRQALIQSVDSKAIIGRLGFVTRAVREPLLVGQLAYDPAYQQASYSPLDAQASLTKDGWIVGHNGIRSKDGKPLELNLYAPDSDEYRALGGELRHYWQALGAQVDVHYQNSQDLQSTLNSRIYDVVLTSISIGVDPDVFVYWHSSQTDPRSTQLNFSDYKSGTADTSLEAGRTRLDPALRVIKYQPFLQAWQKDAPALGLYQPRYLYLSHRTIYGLDQTVLNSGVDRLDSVQNWMIRTAKVTP